MRATVLNGESIGYRVWESLGGSIPRFAGDLSASVAVGAIGPEKGLLGTRMGAIVPDLPFSP
ncbi:hypothetical protein KAM471c_28850 [Aeromonas caviae]|nr:hypothetical protein KAM471c_28850 [Aeromonas caviae]GKR36756.1 hypothetical protein KAM471_25200 [Aeromonas caviae]